MRKTEAIFFASTSGVWRARFTEDARSAIFATVVSGERTKVKIPGTVKLAPPAGVDPTRDLMAVAFKDFIVAVRQMVH